jgi:hypothetical protein
MYCNLANLQQFPIIFFSHKDIFLAKTIVIWLWLIWLCSGQWKPCTPPGRGSPPSRRRVGIEFWAIECFPNVEFLSFRKMIGVEYLARFSSCLIEKGLEKVENLWEKQWIPVELTWGPGWISVEFWATTFLPSVDLVPTACQGLHWPLH